jgi:hypothetical protein
MMYIDGRDKTANLTIQHVNLWTTPARTKVSCRIKHGTKVKVDDMISHQGRRMYLVRSWFKAGWITEEFLSAGGDLV